MKMNKPKISITIVYKDGRVKRVGSRKRRKIFYFFKANNFSDCQIKVCVTYGKGYYNKGIYKNKTDLLDALKIFLEVEYDS